MPGGTAGRSQSGTGSCRSVGPGSFRFARAAVTWCQPAVTPRVCQDGCNECLGSGDFDESLDGLVNGGEFRKLHFQPQKEWIERSRFFFSCICWRWFVLLLYPILIHIWDSLQPAFHAFLTFLMIFNHKNCDVIGTSRLDCWCHHYVIGLRAWCSNRASGSRSSTPWTNRLKVESVLNRLVKISLSSPRNGG